MTWDEILKERSKEKELYDKSGLLYINRTDLDVCNYVAHQLHLYGLEDEQYYFGQEITLISMINTGLDKLSFFDDDILSEMVRIIKSVPFTSNDSTNLQFSTSIACDLDENDVIIPDSLEVSRYIISPKVYEGSVYHFNHEQMHALKDTNYNEYILGISLGEVIPLFYELIALNPINNITMNVLKFRIVSLLQNKFEYYYFNGLIRDMSLVEVAEGLNDREKYECKLYEYLRSRVGCYLNCFYYAVILYNMYKVSPSKILGLVSKVLKHEMTTLDMLNKLNLYGDINGGVFEKELSCIKKLVK